MKAKYLVWGIVALIAAGGFWAGRAFWRIHHQLVTLDVRNMPLADVLGSVEQQTWTKIRAEKGLDARITIRVKDKPLADVLDRLAEQAGANWTTLYAVYDSAGALGRLDSALRGDGKLEPAGWTKLAPNLPPPQLSGPGGPGAGPLPPDPGEPEGQAGGPLRVFQSPEGGTSGGPPPDAPPLVTGGGPRQFSGGGRFMMRRTPGGPIIMRGGSGGETEMWSPETLVMESALNPRLGGEKDLSATAQGAEDAARKVNGKWTTYLALSKSVMGVGFAGPPRQGPGPQGPRLGPLRRNPDEAFARLTPAQRVQRARQRAGFESGIGGPPQ